MKKANKMHFVPLLWVAGLVLTGCNMLPEQNKGLDDGLAASVLTQPLEMPQLAESAGSNCGNEPSYTINGKQYQVLSSAVGYQEEGVASWYGAEYQGSQTAGCEEFDMHGFTAAHRTLPLPTIARVTNLQNGKSVIVKVNDRGPFENNGLIQLSFAAANVLGMTSGSRVAQVKVEAIKSDAVEIKPANAGGKPASRTRAKPSQAQLAAIEKAKQGSKSFFVVVNNYEDQMDALEMFGRLTSVGLNKTELASAVIRGQQMHQVRVGPLYTQDQIDNVRDALESNGLATFQVVEVDK